MIKKINIVATFFEYEPTSPATIVATSDIVSYLTVKCWCVSEIKKCPSHLVSNEFS